MPLGKREIVTPAGKPVHPPAKTKKSKKVAAPNVETHGGASHSTSTPSKSSGMKSTQAFQKAIAQKLYEMGKKDPVFNEKLNSDQKNIDDCITYILNEVKKSGCNAFTDDEIYGMAVHYYDEEEIEVGKPITDVDIRHNAQITETPEDQSDYPLPSDSSDGNQPDTPAGQQQLLF